MAQSLAETHFLEFYNKINFVADVKLFRDNNSTNGSEMNNKITEFSKKDYKLSPCDTFTLIKDITSIHTKNYKTISDIPGKSFPIGTLTYSRNIIITNTFSYKDAAAPTYLDTSLCNIFKYDTSNSSNPSISDLHYIYTVSNDITSNIKQLFTYKNGDDSKYVWEKRKDMLYSFHKPILLTFDIYYYNNLGHHLFDASFDINSTGSSTNTISVDDISTLAQFKNMKPTFFTLLIYYAGYNFKITKDAIKDIYYSKFNKEHTFAIQQYVPPTNESIFINTDSITPIIPNNINLEKETLELFHVGQIDSLWDYVNGKLTILILNMLKHPTEKGIYEKMFKTSYTSNNLFLLDCIEALEKYKKYITSAEEIKNIAFPRSTIKTIEILLIKFSYILSKLEPSFIPNDTVTFNVKVKDTTFTYVVNSQYKATKVDAITISSEMIDQLNKLHDIFDSQTGTISTLSKQIQDVTTKIEEVKKTVDSLPATLASGAGASAASVAASVAAGSASGVSASGVSAASAAASAAAGAATPGIMPHDIAASLNTDISNRMLKVQTIFTTDLLETSYNTLNTERDWLNLITNTVPNNLNIEPSFNQFITDAFNKIWLDTSNTQQAMKDEKTKLTKTNAELKQAKDKVTNYKPASVSFYKSEDLKKLEREVTTLETQKTVNEGTFNSAYANAAAKLKNYNDTIRGKLIGYLVELPTAISDLSAAKAIKPSNASIVAAATAEFTTLKENIIKAEINKTIADALNNYNLSLSLKTSVGTPIGPTPIVGIPINISGKGSCRGATISWTAPPNSKTPIMSYRVETLSFELPIHTKTVKASITTISFSELSNNHAYTFQVYATNKSGKDSIGSESIIITPNSDDCSFTKQAKATMDTHTTNSLKKLENIFALYEISANVTPFKTYEQFSTFYIKYPHYNDNFYVILPFKNKEKSKEIISQAINDVWKDISKNHNIMQEADLDKNSAQFDIDRKAALSNLSNYKFQRRNDLSNAIITKLWPGGIYTPEGLQDIIKIESKYWAAWSLYDYYINYKNKPNYPPPTDVSGVGLYKGVTISWKAPKDTCGNTIAYYTVSGGLTVSGNWGYYTVDGKPDAILKASIDSSSAEIGRDISNITIKDLSAGKLYTFTVSIVYDTSDIMYSALPVPVTPFDKPDAPIRVSCKPFNSAARITWIKPNDNGSIITDYKLKQEPGAAGGTTPKFYDVSATSLAEHIVRGLTNAIEYTFSLVAINKAGNSDESNSIKCTPLNTLGVPTSALKIPDTITGVSGEDGFKRATIFWKMLTPINPPITHYDVFDNSTNKIAKTISGEDISSATITDLSYGTYTYYVKANNYIGTSAAYNTVTVRPYDLPDRPTGVSCEFFDASVKIKWIEPSNNGAPITSYTLYQEGGGGMFSSGKHSHDVSFGLTEYIVKDLTNKTEYTFKLVAINKAGNSAESDSVKCTPQFGSGFPTGKPVRIEGVSGEGGLKSAIISWNPHSANPPITHYDVFDNSTNRIAKTISGEDISRATIIDLSYGIPYIYYVTATNTMGMSVSSDSVTITPYYLPNQPTGVSCEAYNNATRINWIEPSNNGSIITHYKLNQKSGGGGGLFGRPPKSHDYDVSGYLTEYLVKGLTNNTEYTFSLVAINKAGDSSGSDSVKCTPKSNKGDPKLTLVKPLKIEGVSGEGGFKIATISWNPHSANPPITHYDVFDNSTNNIVKTISGGDISSATITDLSYGITYTYYVTATNYIGMSISSGSVTVRPYDLPNKPTGVSCEAYDTAVKIKWIEPSNNGSDITGYTLTQKLPLMKGAPSIQLYGVSGDAKEHIVRGLINESQYIFKLVAINNAGNSAESDSVKCTPTFTIGKASPAGIVGIPGIPPRIISVSGEPGYKSAIISWIQPSAYPPVTKYKVYNNSTNRIEKTINITSKDISSATIPGLSYGTTYTYYVRATNDRGTSLSSDIVTVTPYDVPNIPTGVSCESFDKAVKIKWIEPSNNGAPITVYKLYQESGMFSSGKHSHDVSANSTEHIVDGLTNTTEYTFKLVAINKAGNSAESNSVKCIPQSILGDPKSTLRIPPIIRGVSGEAGDRSAIISWNPPSVNPPITKYDVYNDSTNIKAKTINGKDASRVEIDSLTNGTTYTYYVTATNKTGMSVSSERVTIIPSGVPIFTTPKNDFGGTAHCTYVKLNWKEPSNNGRPILNYTISMNAVSSLASPLQEPTIVSGDFSYTYILNLKNDISYTFIIKATNEAGFSNPATIILTPSYDVCDLSFMNVIKSSTISKEDMSKNLNITKAILELSNIELSFNTNTWTTIFSNLSGTPINTPVNDSSKNSAFTKLYEPKLKTMRKAMLDGILDGSYSLFDTNKNAAILELSDNVIPNIEASFNNLHIDLCDNNHDLSRAQVDKVAATSALFGYGTSAADAAIDKAIRDISSKKLEMLNNKIEFYLAKAFIDTLNTDACYNTYYTNFKNMIDGISNERFDTLQSTKEAKAAAAAAAAAAAMVRAKARAKALTTPPPQPVKIPGYKKMAKRLGLIGGSTTRKKTVSGNKSKTKKNKELKSEIKSELKSKLKSKLKSELKSELKSKTESKTKIRAISKTRKIMKKNKQ